MITAVQPCTPAHTPSDNITPSYPTIFNNIRSVHLSLSTLTVGSPSHELQLHHMWLLTLFVHGARSLQFLLFEPTTTFFLIPKMRAQSQCWVDNNTYANMFGCLAQGYPTFYYEKAFHIHILAQAYGSCQTVFLSQLSQPYSGSVRRCLTRIYNDNSNNNDNRGYVQRHNTWL